MCCVLRFKENSQSYQMTAELKPNAAELKPKTAELKPKTAELKPQS